MTQDSNMADNNGIDSGNDQAFTENIELTLEPEVEQPVLAAVSELNSVVPDDVEETLTKEELKIVNDFASQIDLRDTNLVMQYGSAAQKKMANFTDDALAGVRTRDLGEVGSLISGVVNELKGFDAEEEKGLFGFFKKKVNKVQMLRTRYDKVENNVDKIAKSLEEQQVTLMKDSAMLDKMYELNMVYFKELTMYIVAGKQKLAEIRNGELANLRKTANETGRTEDAQAVRDLEEACDRFEKKLSDLLITREISLQTAPQIRIVQNGEVSMIQKIQTTLVNTIPLWKNQMVLALGLANSEAAVKAQRAVTDMTNDLLKKNAETLHTSSVAIAKESERSIVDIETLRQTNESLIKTLDEVMQIQKEGRIKRAEAESEIQKLEGELKNKLLEMQN